MLQTVLQPSVVRQWDKPTRLVEAASVSHQANVCQGTPDTLKAERHKAICIVILNLRKLNTGTSPAQFSILHFS